ncbi:PD-(D/E)XK motif protein [Pelagibacterales bacterium]|nr:PD-(D/E)XK motif protein [Pelagibacterales bacterium]
MELRKKIDNHWETLKTSKDNWDGWRTVLIPSQNSIDIMVALLKPRSSVGIGIHISKQNTEEIKKLNYKNFKIEIQKRESAQDVIFIYLIDDIFYDIFLDFSVSVIQDILNLHDDSKLVSTLKSKLDTWSRFMKHGSKRILSRELQVGLLGELFCLDKIYFQNFDHLSALNQWEGPYSKLHDFRNPQISIEVKSTCSEPVSKISIDNCKQFDEEKANLLILCLQEFNINTPDGKVLPYYINEIKQKISKNDSLLNKFYDCLENYGYFKEYEDLYDDLFSFTKTSFYEVNEKFPKIKYKNLPDQLNEVKYDLNIPGIINFKIDINIVLDKLKESNL